MNFFEEMAKFRVQLDKMQGDIDSISEAQRENRDAAETIDTQIQAMEEKAATLRREADTMEERKQTLIQNKEMIMSMVSLLEIQMTQIQQGYTAIKQAFEDSQPREVIDKTFQEFEELSGIKADSTPTLRDDVSEPDLEAVGT